MRPSMQIDQDNGKASKNQFVDIFNEKWEVNLIVTAIDTIKFNISYFKQSLS